MGRSRGRPRARAARAYGRCGPGGHRSGEAGVKSPPPGHKIICQIAFQELNEKARNEVIRLIALVATFDSFTDACTWPDHPQKRAEEHFINVARSTQAITTATCTVAPKCLFTGIAACP